MTVTDATGRKTLLAYGLDGQLAQVRDGDGRHRRTSSYDTQLQLTQLVGPSGETYRYTYDANGNLTGIHDPLRQTDRPSPTTRPSTSSPRSPTPAATACTTPTTATAT